MKLELHIAPELDELARLSDRLDGTLLAEGVNDERVGQARLILEELVCNAITHGAAPANAPLEVAVELSRAALVLELRDRGRPFDPRQAPVPELNADIGEREVGGLGLYLVNQLADHVNYGRLDGCNRIRATLLDPFCASPSRSIPESL